MLLVLGVDGREGGRSHGPAPRAAFGVQEVDQGPETFGLGAVSLELALAYLLQQSGLPESVEMVGERGGRNAKLVLDFPGNQTLGMSCEQRPHDREPRLVSECGHHPGKLENLLTRFHASRILELSKDSCCLFKRPDTSPPDALMCPACARTPIGDLAGRRFTSGFQGLRAGWASPSL